MTDTFNGEQCAGCGQFAPSHPVYAVMAADDAAGTVVGTSEDEKFVVVPTCMLCHVDPAHRQRPIKGHFFLSKAEAVHASSLAGERDTAGRPQRTPAPAKPAPDRTGSDKPTVLKRSH